MPDDPGAPPDDHDPAVADTASSDPGSPGEPAARKGPRRVRSGDALGRYQLGDELGEGGMATVFRARDRELRRDVAVKVLFPHLARRPEIVQRFQREARAAAGLEHPNILRVYDVGGADGDDPPYIVMELVRGRTLLQEIEQRGAMLAEVTACIGALLGDALAAAHASGVIHRDVKPANVLIAPGGRLLLGDFGVARLETEDSLVTRTGALLGTPAYMSPEQASGDIATTRSDLYSLGVTLYQLATGSLPYAGPPARVMSLIAAGSLVAPVRRRSSCGPDLSRLIERLMAVDPASRPATAPAIAVELRALVSSGGLGDPSEELAAYFEDPEGFLRARTPVVVGRLVAAAHAAIAGDKLPRAMALADRASALLPGDPAVIAVVHAATEGGHASRRKRRIAIAGLAIAVAGGAAALGWWRWGAPDDAPQAAEPATGTIDEGAGALAMRAAVDAQQARSATSAGTEAVSSVATGAGQEAAPSAATRTGAEAAPNAATSAGQEAAPSAATRTGAEAAPNAATGAGQAAAPSVAARAGAEAAPNAASGAGKGAVPSAATGAGKAAASSTVTRVGKPAVPSAASGAGKGAAPVPEHGDRTPSATSSLQGSAGPASGDPVAAPPPEAPPAIDAAVSPEPPATGHLVVRNDVWCNIWVDGTSYGNRRNEPIEVSAGRHVVRCVNPLAGEWRQDTEVVGGATRTLAGTLLRELQVTLEVDATINGRSYARGAVVKLKPGNVEVIAGGRKQFITFRESCTLRDTPTLGCYL